MTGTHRKPTPSQRRQQIAIVMVFVVSLASMIVGATLWAGAEAPVNVFSKLSGGGLRPVPPGTLQVDDIAADPLGYQATITVRGVVARVYPDKSHQLLLVDSREAKLCKSVGCAKFYLPVVTKTEPLPQVWDEIDLRGTMVQGDRYPYFEAANIENLGPFE